MSAFDIYMDVGTTTGKSGDKRVKAWDESIIAIPSDLFSARKIKFKKSKYENDNTLKSGIIFPS